MEKSGVNPELANIRAALWGVYHDLREGEITADEASVMGELLYELGQLLELELQQKDTLRSAQNPAEKPTDKGGE